MFRKPAVVAVEPLPPPAVPETPAKTCPECGKFYRSDATMCAPCGLRALLDAEPKQNPDYLPCAICDITHIHAEWEKRSVLAGGNKGQILWLCDQCADIKDRNLAPDFGSEEEEMILSLRVLQVYGYSQPWRKRGGDRWLRKSTVRDVLRVPRNERPKIAAEMPTYRPTTEMREPVAWLGIDQATLFRYVNTDTHKARRTGHVHEPRTIENLMWDVQAAEYKTQEEARLKEESSRMSRDRMPLSAQLYAASQESR